MLYREPQHKALKPPNNPRCKASHADLLRVAGALAGLILGALTCAEDVLWVVAHP